MKIMLIGAGVIARTHAAAAALLGEPVEILAADPSADARDAFAAEHPHTRFFESADAMLAEPVEVDDIVIVATPPRHHAAPTLAAFASGRHVLVEKPFAMTVDEAETMLAASIASNRLLGVCSTRFRGLPHTEAVKAALADGLIGEPYALRFQNVWPGSRPGIEYQPQSLWFLDRSQAGGGVVMDWGPYDVSTLLELLRPTSVEVRDAWLGTPGLAGDPTDVVHDVESHAGASMRFHLPSGLALPVVLERANHSSGEAISAAELLGDRGSLRWTPFDSAQPVRHTDDSGTVTDLERPATLDASPMDRPLVFFRRHLRGLPSFASVGAAPVDELRLMHAIYDVAGDGMPRTVDVRGPIATASRIEELL
jgi:predicted dehydrogenase